MISLSRLINASKDGMVWLYITGTTVTSLVPTGDNQETIKKVGSAPNDNRMNS